MITKLLIANRGEIAVRIARTARRMGVATVAVYSDADGRALHVAACDEARHIGPAPAALSYLSIERIIEAARTAGADAVHPGYGFLAENPMLAEACAEAGLVFVGPPADAMRRLGDKAAAKALAVSLCIPVVPGYNGDSQALATLKREAKRIGYPLMIKAAAGGGGRGMRVVREAGELPAALESAAREAAGAFGDSRLLLERLVERPRHIEVQVFADRHGNVVHLFERECSLQRRHQKVIEEAPAPGIAQGLRSQLADAAVRLAAAAGYEGAGTVEFLVESGELRDDAPFFFIEANTRLQVEHPVTEEITGVDLVEWQLRVAAGEPLPLTQDAIRLVSTDACAIELRICAEDPAHGFRASTGRLVAMRHNGPDRRSRFETGVREGDTVTSDYDSMLAKLVETAASRDEALDRARSSLDALCLAGPRTNIRFLRNLLTDDDVVSARLDTGLIDRKLGTLADATVGGEALQAGIKALLASRSDRRRPAEAEEAPPVVHASAPWLAADGFQIGGPRNITYTINVDGQPTAVRARWNGTLCQSLDLPPRGDADQRRSGTIRCIPDGAAVLVLDDGAEARLSWPSDDIDIHHHGETEGDIRAPITGHVAKVLVALGGRVSMGDPIAVIEAMKMEHVLHAPRSGRIAALAVKGGDQVSEGALIAELLPPEDEEEGRR
jgi:3-methylcrotonyl-CoA carboxylase alpha subunit